jgi:LAS superfamily LD-carboxypeptidase LdcB
MQTRFLERLNGKPSVILGVIVLGAVAYGAFYTYRNLESEKAKLYEELELVRESNYSLMRIIDEREATINDFQGQIETIAGTVGDLHKLAQTDEELLKKYSKVYFLNENYIPARLSEIDKLYLNKEATNIQIHADVWPKLERLLMAARRDDINLLVASAYRSFETQTGLKANYKVLYGSGANAFSADQGYSEHQLGTAVDFTTPISGLALLQPTDPAYKWLQENAHDYGFTLSYPQSNVYYKFEPWHWRYVGVDLAIDLHEDRKYFYDLDQREIDEYLIKFFD